MWLSISVTFLNGMFHGRGDQGTPEWPPSPLRLFQSLLAVSEGDAEPQVRALDWLASLSPPQIVTPPIELGTPYRSSVPNNAMDLVARAWSKGGTGKDAQPSTHKAMKTIQSTHLIAEPAEQRVCYLWELPAGDEASSHHVDVLAELASRLVAVGWGLDLVAGHARIMAAEEQQQLAGERWLPRVAGRVSLRAAHGDTQTALRSRYQFWLNRLSGGTLNPVPALPPDAYRTVGYARESEAVAPPVAAFSVLTPDAAGYRPYPLLRGMEVAGMLRHITAGVARRAGREQPFIDGFVLGHGEPHAADHQSVGLQRLAFVPLPSLEPRREGGRAEHVAQIRRVLLYVPEGNAEREIDWLRRLLPGNALVRTETAQEDALLSLLPASDKVIQRYLTPKATWATVTPVILPGRDDRKPAKAEKLIRKTIVQAGLPEALARQARIDFSKTGFWPGAERVDRYCVPYHLRDFPRYHVRITWFDAAGREIEVPGPLVLGGGRFFGLGLLAAMD